MATIVVLNPDEEPDSFVRNALKLAAWRKTMHTWEKRIERANHMNKPLEVLRMMQHELERARFEYKQAEYAVLFPKFA